MHLCRLPIAEVEKLDKRRNYIDLLFLNKLLNGTVNFSGLLSLIGLSVSPVRYNFLFYIVPSNRNFVFHSPISRILHYSYENPSEFDFLIYDSYELK